jgi:hypothetical protein
MGKIRGTHSSPGVYTRPWAGGRKNSTRDNRKGTLDKNSGSDGGGKGGGPWVFSDYFVIVFS